MQNDKIDVFNLSDHFNSIELADKLAILHRRKAQLNVTIRALQSEIGRIEKGSEERSKKTDTLNNYLQEQSGVAELISEFNVLYKSALDQIMLDILKEQHHEVFTKVLAKAKIVYDNKTGGKNV